MKTLTSETIIELRSCSEALHTRAECNYNTEVCPPKKKVTRWIVVL